MTTNAQLATQVADALTRWNAQLDQLGAWLAGDPAGGPEGDGKYPLTNAAGETENFLCLPAVLDLVDGPAAAAAVAQAAAEAAEALVESHKDDAEAAQALAEAARNTATALRDETKGYRDETASHWANVSTKAAQVAADTPTVTAARDETLTARDEAVAARDEAEAFAISAATFDPAQFLPTTGGTMSGTLTVEDRVTVGSAAQGRVVLVPQGSSAYTGYIEWRLADNTRLAYMGLGSSAKLVLALDNGTPELELQGSLEVKEDAAIVGDLTVDGRNILTELDARPPSTGKVFANADRTLTAADVGPVLYHSSSTAHTFTTPDSADTAFPEGGTVRIYNYGSGPITLTRGASVFMRKAGGTTNKDWVVAAYGYAELTRIASNIWLATGDVS